MTVKVLSIGDVLGRPGRRIIREFLPAIKNKWELDCVVANIENAAGGFGITHKVYSELKRHGVDLMTSGNHIYDKPETRTWIDDTPDLIRPMNFPPGSPGQDQACFTTASGVVIKVINLIGRVFMKPYDCPFRAADNWFNGQEKDYITLVDFHAEATSEKQAMGWYLAERASAVWGTHTHVPTNDARILNQHTGFMTDLGMTGPYDSVIGMKIPAVLDGFLTLNRTRFEVASGDLRLGGCLFEFDSASRKCRSIQSVHLSYQDLKAEIAE
ncbi:MAG: TIGR00282 family metallophosphoesterase [Acidobacteria bacterium]|nr:MAG: TIGR00282 family metallophosphoesterase [Acidobacteriota bacterium]